MTTAPFQRSFIEVNGLRTAHAVFGDTGDAVVALHGWGASIDLIAPFAIKLAARGFRVYAPDLPGFGETPAPQSAWSVHDYTNFVSSYMAANGLDHAHLFGHSFGGRLSLILGADHAARVEKIVLANSAGVPPRRSMSSQVRLNTYKGIRDGLNAVGMKALSQRLRDWYVGRYSSADYRNAGVLRDTFVKVISEDLRPYAARIKASTLLIWGARDDDTPLWQAQTLEKLIPDAGLVVYDDAGHYSYLDRLPDVVKTVEYFYRH
jgi:pimeloyl-ACP methyl ester carboxylesterase